MLKHNLRLLVEEHAEDFQGLHRPCRVVNPVGVDAVLPDRQGIAEVLHPRLGQKLLAEVGQGARP